MGWVETGRIVKTMVYEVSINTTFNINITGANFIPGAFSVQIFPKDMHFVSPRDFKYGYRLDVVGGHPNYKVVETTGAQKAGSSVYVLLTESF
ncbi:MAG: hypothetical protein ACRCSG_00115 [Cellulosilyticaceae bacterium]